MLRRPTRDGSTRPAPRRPAPRRPAPRAIATVGAALLVPAGWSAAGAAPAPAAAQDAAQEARVERRLGGASRVDTAVEISRYQFPDGAEEVYLSDALNPVDAVAGGSLTRGPTLLVPRCGRLPDAVAAEVTRLDPHTIVALGGKAAVAQEIVDQAVAGRADPAAACPGDPPAADPQGLELVVVEQGRAAGDAVARGGVAEGPFVRVAVVNRTDRAVRHGGAYTLERLVGAGYEPLDPPLGPFGAAAFTVEPGATGQALQIGPDLVQGGRLAPLTAGSYRLTLTVTLTETPTAGDAPLRVEFTVE